MSRHDSSVEELRAGHWSTPFVKQINRLSNHCCDDLSCDVHSVVIVNGDELPQQFIDAFYPKPCFVWRYLIIIISFLTSFADVYSDLVLGCQHANRGEDFKIIACLTFTFALFANVFRAIDKLDPRRSRSFKYLNIAIRDCGQTQLAFLTATLSVSFAIGFVASSNHMVKTLFFVATTLMGLVVIVSISSDMAEAIADNWTSQKEARHRSIVTETSILGKDISSLFEMYLEALPQLSLQFYVLLTTEDISQMRKTEIVGSVMTSLGAVAMSSYNLHSFTVRNEMELPSWSPLPLTIVTSLGTFLELLVRVVVITLTIEASGPLGILIVIVIFIIAIKIELYIEKTFYNYKGTIYDFQDQCTMFFTCLAMPKFSRWWLLMTKTGQMEITSYGHPNIRFAISMTIQNLILLALWAVYTKSNFYCEIFLMVILFQTLTLFLKVLKIFMKSIPFAEDEEILFYYYRLMKIFVNDERARQVAIDVAQSVPKRKTFLTAVKNVWNKLLCRKVSKNSYLLPQVMVDYFKELDRGSPPPVIHWYKLHRD